MLGNTAATPCKLKFCVAACRAESGLGSAALRNLAAELWQDGLTPNRRSRSHCFPRRVSIDSLIAGPHLAGRTTQHIAAKESRTANRTSLGRLPLVDRQVDEPENGRRGKKRATAEDVDRGQLGLRVLRKCRTK